MPKTNETDSATDDLTEAKAASLSNMIDRVIDGFRHEFPLLSQRIGAFVKAELKDRFLAYAPITAQELDAVTADPSSELCTEIKQRFETWTPPQELSLIDTSSLFERLLLQVFPLSVDEWMEFYSRPDFEAPDILNDGDAKLDEWIQLLIDENLIQFPIRELERTNLPLAMAYKSSWVSSAIMTFWVELPRQEHVHAFTELCGLVPPIPGSIAYWNAAIQLMSHPFGRNEAQTNHGQRPPRTSRPQKFPKSAEAGLPQIEVDATGRFVRLLGIRKLRSGDTKPSTFAISHSVDVDEIDQSLLRKPCLRERYRFLRGRKFSVTFETARGCDKLWNKPDEERTDAYIRRGFKELQTFLTQEHADKAELLLAADTARLVRHGS